MTVAVRVLLLSAANLAIAQYDFDQPQVLPIGSPPAYEPPLETTNIPSPPKSYHVPGLPKPAAPTPTKESAEGAAYGSSTNDLNDVMSTLDNLAHESGIGKVLEGLTISEKGDRVGVVLYSSRSMHKEKIKLGSINDPGKLLKTIKR
uniref:PRC domain-containing protein n=1 Tax=Heterorhabditis bacteriophora TaxID=37862 RepID=A0A1I7WLT5_HETBA